MAFIELILVIAMAIAPHAAPAQPDHGKTNGHQVEHPFCDPSYEQGQGQGC